MVPDVPKCEEVVQLKKSMKGSSSTFFVGFRVHKVSTRLIMYQIIFKKYVEPNLYSILFANLSDIVFSSKLPGSCDECANEAQD